MVVAEMALDTEEAAYVAHAARAAVAEAAAVSGGEGEGRPDVLIVVPDPALHEPLLAALRAEDIVAVDTIGSQSSYDPAVRYVLAWLRVLGDHSDEQWERVLASPLARLPAADLARLREWAIKKRLTLDAALRATAGGDGPSIADAARSRLAELARLLDELRHSARYEGYEAPSVTLHRLLAREDLVGALLVGPHRTRGQPPDPRGLAGSAPSWLAWNRCGATPMAARPVAGLRSIAWSRRRTYLNEHAAAPGRAASSWPIWPTPPIGAPARASCLASARRSCRARAPQSRLLSEAALAQLRRAGRCPGRPDFAAYARASAALRPGPRGGARSASC